ncbi:V-type ATP synthase subunit I [bacterium BMS3Abin03]|nr:V-type ATP synthase subunit I [bacterium BMS3Abin03]
MALSAVKKIMIFLFPEFKEKALNLLQLQGEVHLDSVESILPEDLSKYFRHGSSTETTHKISNLENRLHKIEETIELLGKYQKKNVLSNFLQPLEYVNLEQFKNLSSESETHLINKVAELENTVIRLEKEIRKYKFDISQLQIIKDTGLKLENISDTKEAFILLIKIAVIDWQNFETQANELLSNESHVEIVSNNKHGIAALIIGLKDKKINFLEMLKQQSAEILEFNNLEGTPNHAISNLREKINVAMEKMNKVRRELKNLTAELPKFHLFYDYVKTELDKESKTELLKTSKYTLLITGWIEERNLQSLNQKFNSENIEAAIIDSEPEENDNPPAKYDNPGTIKPFEFVTDMYSRPKYWEIDPTPFLGAFFALFFAICLTDMGYGIVLSIVTFIALKKLKGLSANSRKLMKILFYSGIATTFAGLFTGGIFGVPFDNLPDGFTWLNNIVVLNPLQNQMGFLIFSLSLGIIHVSFGIFLKFYWNLKHKNTCEAFLDQAPWLAILLGVVMLGTASAVDVALLSNIGYILMIAAGAVILLFAGRSSKSIWGRFGLGLFSLYQVSGLLGDILSYARLFALGLATGVIAGVVNFLAELTLGIPYLGYILMPVILVAGHLMNIVINALGGFIHTSRLQFVEFFGKFYEGGGEPFEPFKLNLKYTKIKEQETL